MLKTWNLTLIIGTFLLTLFGTFLTRSGVIESVHAFTEGMIGPLFLAFMTFIMISSLVLIAWRSDRLYSPGSLDSVTSRESAFLVNTLLFVAFTFTVLLGTTFPLIIELIRGDRVSIGPPYFNMVTVPIGLMILFLMGVGPALPWRRATKEKLQKSFMLPVTMGLVVAAVTFALGVREIYPIVTFAFAGFVMTTILEEFRKGVSARKRISGDSGLVALGQILTRNNRRYGGYIVHIGVVVICVALSISGTWRFEREATIQKGEELTIGDYAVRLDEVWGRQEAQRFVVGSTFTILVDGREVDTMQPRLNYYQSSQQPIGTPAVRSTPKEDLYLTLMAFDSESGSEATIRAIVNPGVPWLWIGGMIMAIGSILAIAPQRRGTTRFDPLQAVEKTPQAAELPAESREEEAVVV